jgi:hypothetical protein
VWLAYGMLSFSVAAEVLLDCISYIRKPSSDYFSFWLYMSARGMKIGKHYSRSEEAADCNELV